MSRHNSFLIVLFLSDTRKKLVHNTMNTTIFSPAKTFRATTTTTSSSSSFSRRSCCSKSRRAVVVTNVTKAREFFFPKHIFLPCESRPLFVRAREDRERERERQESSATSGAFFETRDDDSVLNCDFLSPFRPLPPPPPRCTKNLWIRLDIFVFSTDTKASFILF